MKFCRLNEKKKKDTGNKENKSQCYQWQDTDARADGMLRVTDDRWPEGVGS